MDCVRCGITLPEGAINCPNCGMISAISNSFPTSMNKLEVPALTNAEVAAQREPVSPPLYQPGQQPASSQPYLADQLGPGTLPASIPPVRRKKRGLSILLIILVMLLLVGGGIGTGVYFATRPQPVIHVSSDYKVGAIYAGSANTKFRLTGQKFSENSDITILLDGSPAPGKLPVHSDSNGAIVVTLTVTSNWFLGKHTITARDTAGYLTKAGEQIMIVVPGEAHTPGPNGAPPDDASGQIVVSIRDGGEVTLLVTNSQGKRTVCGSLDDGKPHSHDGRSSGLTFTETIVSSCRGAYKGGKVTYTQTVTSDTIRYSNGVRCSTQTPYTAVQLDGTFSNPTEVSGTVSRDKVTVNCDHGVGNITVNAQTSTWSGNWTAAS